MQVIPQTPHKLPSNSPQKLTKAIGTFVDKNDDYKYHSIRDIGYRENND